MKKPLYILSLVTAITSSICLVPAHAFVLSFSNLDDLDDSTEGEALSPDNSIDEGIFQSDTELFFFQEQFNLNLASDLNVDANQPGTYDRDLTSPGIISAGTLIDSYYFSFDILNTPSNSATSNVAQIEFSQPILGIIYLRESLDSTDSVLSRNGITYPTDLTLRRGVEVDPGITWNNDNVNLSAQLSVNNNSALKVDQFRVITAADIPFNFSPTLGLIIVLSMFFLHRIVSRS